MPSLNDSPRLRNQLGVNHRQKRRVIADVVLHHQHDRNAHGSCVVGRIALVLDVLHDRDQNADVPLPQEDALDVAYCGLRATKFFNLAIIVGEDDDRDVQASLP